MDNLKEKLETIYTARNRRDLVDPDPLAFLYAYPDVRDREIAGLVAACLAYGRVEMIMKTVGQVLEIMGPSPFRYLADSGQNTIRAAVQGFKYRFARDTHLAGLLLGMKRVIEEYNSLANCFLSGEGPEDPTTLSGLAHLTRCLDPLRITGHLLADPLKNSACKRSHLFLRWMVREDCVDPGGWVGVSTERLIVPLDTHMFKVGTFLGFTRAKAAGRKSALEITAGFRAVNKSDPVKYDFSLTRFGIRRELGMEDLEKFLTQPTMKGS